MKLQLLTLMAISIGLDMSGANQALEDPESASQVILESNVSGKSVRLAAESDFSGSLSPYEDFFKFARTQLAARKAKSAPGRSVLLEPFALANWPQRTACRNGNFAVSIDIDPEQGVFDLSDPPLPHSGLALDLAQLRQEGIVVVWVTDLSSASSENLRTILAATELDSAGQDLLAMASGQASKHDALRKIASRICLIAMAGDRIGDFEQGYDFLRDKSGPLAKTLSANLGDGWFIVPAPIS